MNIKKVLQITFLVLVIGSSLTVIYFFLGEVPKTENPEFGVVFSQKHARDLGLNWQHNYSALLKDLEVKKIKVISHWDLIEPERGNYRFRDLDWQLEEARKNGTEVILVIGMKTGRWPECHIPDWAKQLNKEEQQEVILRLVHVLVNRYSGYRNIVAWSVENEPLFQFGDCPWVDKEHLKEEIELVRSLDSFFKKPIMITDSGEASLWIEAANLGDFVGVTMYREVWMSDFNRYFSYPLPPFYYWKKKDLISQQFDKKVICAELQAEPWGPSLLYSSPFEEQMKTMNIDLFKENIQFARQTGFEEFYLWGAEWWYWMKTEKKQPQIWNEAKKLF